MRYQQHDELSAMSLRRQPKTELYMRAYYYGRTLSDASMLYFADVFFIFFYARLSWPNG